MRILPAILLVLPSTALAAWPEDVSLSSMTEHEGLAVLDKEVLGESYKQLVMELGTAIANKPMTPAETLGSDGFEFGVQLQTIFQEAAIRGDAISPWERSHIDEDPAAYGVMPTFTARKGLPLSTEVGGSVGWLGGSSTGMAGIFGRVAITEGYKPLPDISVKLGYAGYVGNDELDLGTLDLGVTIGTTAPVGNVPGANVGRIQPFASFTTLRVSANPVLDEETQAQIDAIRYQRSKIEEFAAPLVIPQFSAGLQFESGTSHVRLASTWAPTTIPTLIAGLGFTY